MISPTTIEPTSEPTNAPTMPPQKRSGSQIVKCQIASPIMTQPSMPISATSRGGGSSAGASWAAVSARPSGRGPRASGRRPGRARAGAVLGLGASAVAAAGLRVGRRLGAAGARLVSSGSMSATSSWNSSRESCWSGSSGAVRRPRRRASFLRVRLDVLGRAGRGGRVRRDDAAEFALRCDARRAR